MPIDISEPPRTVKTIHIQIGDEFAKHTFGREVDMAYARKWALHYVNCFTGFDLSMQPASGGSNVVDGRVTRPPSDED